MDAATRRVLKTNQLIPTSVLALKGELARGRCVAFDIPVFDSWYRNNRAYVSGNIGVPIPGERSVGGHAMCLVGYQDNAAEEAIGGGRFILRNSWNGNWGTQSPYGPGYGTIPYAYISAYGQEAYSID